MRRRLVSNLQTLDLDLSTIRLEKYVACGVFPPMTIIGCRRREAVLGNQTTYLVALLINSGENMGRQKWEWRQNLTHATGKQSAKSVVDLATTRALQVGFRKGVGDSEDS